MENKLIKIQEMLFDEMMILKEIDTKDGLLKRELQKSEKLAVNAANFIKSVNTNMKIIEMADSKKINTDAMNELLGIK